MVVVLFELKECPEADLPDYRAMLRCMEEIVAAMPGYISSKDFISEDRNRDLSMVPFESLEAWRTNPEHQQKFGMSGQLTQDLLGLLRLLSCVHVARQNERVISR